MRILHTADWHLGDRLGGVDRTADIRRAVERVAAYCKEERVDVCLVAGDIFSDRHPRDRIQDSIEHLAATFEEFLLGGGTVLALTGNHDNEAFCQTLKQMMRLAAPAPVLRGDLVAGGRWYLATGPTFLRLKDGDAEVQFVLMPYPTISRYVGKQELHISSVEEKHRILHAALLSRLREIQSSRKFSSILPTVFAAHAFVGGAMLPHRFRITEHEDIVFSASEMPTDWAYVAFGHLHRPQCIQGMPHVRYSGSIERLDMGERGDSKQVVVVEIGRRGRLAEPIGLPLAATPFYDVKITNPQQELPHLRQRYPEAAQALVRYHVTFNPGRDNLNEILTEVNRVFPRWYDRTWTRSGGFQRKAEKLEITSAPHPEPSEPEAFTASFHDTVMDYLRFELNGNGDREEVLKLAEKLLAEESG